MCPATPCSPSKLALAVSLLAQSADVKLLLLIVQVFYSVICTLSMPTWVLRYEGCLELKVFVRQLILGSGILIGMWLRCADLLGNLQGFDLCRPGLVYRCQRAYTGQLDGMRTVARAVQLWYIGAGCARHHMCCTVYHKHGSTATQTASRKQVLLALCSSTQLYLPANIQTHHALFDQLL